MTNAIQMLEKVGLDEAPVRAKGLMRQLATFISANADKPETLGQLHLFLGDLAKNVKDLMDATNAHVVANVQSGGEVTTEKGSRRLEAGGLELRIRPWRTGYDPKLVEKLFKLKKMSLDHWMTPETTYKFNEAMFRNAINQGLVTAAEAAECEYEIKWVVEQPRPVRGLLTEGENDE